MDISDALSLMLTFGMFLIALLTYIDRNNRRK
ncbi:MULTISPECIES: putative holin-like toxin [Faecalicatena]|nr:MULTISPECIES: putative holin-like toxin [Clostridia]